MPPPVAPPTGCRSATAALALLERLAGEGELVVVMGAGDVDGLGRRAGRGRGAVIEPARDVSLARLTTVRTGGLADHFAAAGSRRELLELLGWARERGLAVHVVGSGSNLLVADAGVRGLVIKLERELARIEQDGVGLRCGGGARLPAVAARAATLGLGGIEFAVNIPGTVGGAVRMNANAYDGALADVLDWVEIVTADGVSRRGPDELGFAYRRSGLLASEIVVAGALRARAGGARGDSRDPARRCASAATPPSRRGSARSARPSRTHRATPPASCSPPPASRISSSAARASRASTRTSSRTPASASTADIVALIAAGRARVRERFGIELEPEVQLLGDVRFPW